MREPNERYLGDGLYASFDGWQIKLRAPRGEGDHVVFLEPSVYASLVAYVSSLRKEQEAEDDPQSQA